MTINIPIYSVPDDALSEIKWIKEKGNNVITTTSDVTVDQSATNMNCSFHQKIIKRPGHAAIMTINSFKEDDEGNYTLEVGRSNTIYNYIFAISLSGLFINVKHVFVLKIYFYGIFSSQTVFSSPCITR